MEQNIENDRELYYFDPCSVQCLGDYALIENGLIGLVKHFRVIDYSCSLIFLCSKDCDICSELQTSLD